MKPEQKLQNQICDYLRLQYPSVLFMVSPSGIKLTIGQATNLKRNQNPSKGWPDLLIMHRGNGICSGLFLELKPQGTVIYKKDGLLRKNEHLEQQEKVHKLLHERGYKACFAVGFDEAKRIIDFYLK